MSIGNNKFLCLRSPERTDILTSLFFATSHMSLQMHSPSKIIDPLPQRVMAAMLIVLFSVGFTLFLLFQANCTPSLISDA